MHAVKNGIIALGISVCLSSSPATAQYRAAPRPPLGPPPTAAPPTAAPTTRAGSVHAGSVHAGSVHAGSVHAGHRPSGVAQAVARGGPAPGAVRQVAGRQSPHAPRNSSGGLLGSWFGSGESRNTAPHAPQSLFERIGLGDGEKAETPHQAAKSADAQPNWEGVPYHRPHRATTAGGSAPITDPKDPSNRQLSRSVAQAQPTRSAANPQIPVPPAEGASRASRTERPSVAQLPTPFATSRPAPSPSPAASSSATYGALSATESSRRSGRRVVDPLDAYLDSEPELESASPVRADGQGPIADRGIADGPRVARRPVPAVSNAATSRRRTGAATGSSMPPSLAAADQSSTELAEGSSTTDSAADSGSTSGPALGTPVDPAATPAPALSRADGSRSPALNAAVAAPAGEPAAADSAESLFAAADVSAETSAAEAPAPLVRKSAPGGSSSPSPGESSVASSGDAWRASSTAQTQTATQADALKQSAAQTQPAAQAQLGVNARNAVGASLDASQTAVSVNTQPVNVVAEIPGIRVVTSGPAEIPIRQAVNYEVRVENRGSIAAPGALIRVTLPRWIGVQTQKASRGEIGEESNQREQQLLWQVEGLPAGSAETLTLALSAVEARQFDVAVEWAVLPQSNIAHVQVLEPKLELVIDGPDRVIYGQSQSYKVRVLNPGNGNAENVVFTLSPNSKTPQSQQIGRIPAGKEAHFEVELTARDRESLQIHGLAIGASGLETELTKSIEVVAADLEAVLSGPPLRYQASSAAYKLEITNRGDAACEQLTAVLQLPAGVKYEGGLPQPADASGKTTGAETSGNAIQWQVGQLAPGESAEYEFHCMMQETGEQKIAFQCEGTAAGAANVAFTTNVETLADLVLSVADPSAPAPVGEEVTYEIVLRNRGSKAATDVQTLAQFSDDVEPVRVEGGTGKVAPGQVVFDAIPRIEPGEELRLKVVAKAEKAGLHRFRTEIRSGETLLISEEATRYIELAGERVSQRSSSSEAELK